MCARVTYLLLFCFFTYITTTVAAFVYLEWWQAIFVSAISFVGILFLLKVGAKRYVRSFAKQLNSTINQRSRVLKDASIQVHKIQPSSIPKEVLQHQQQMLEEYKDELEQLTEEEKSEVQSVKEDWMNRKWYFVDISIFPNAANVEKTIRPLGQVCTVAASWQPKALRLVPLESQEIEMVPFVQNNEIVEYELWSLSKTIEGEDEVISDDEEVTGVARIQFFLGVKSNHRLLKFLYINQYFGRIELPLELTPKSIS